MNLKANVESSKPVYHIILSSAETTGAFNTGFDIVNLHRHIRINMTLYLYEYDPPYTPYTISVYILGQPAPPYRIVAPQVKLQSKR